MSKTSVNDFEVRAARSFADAGRSRFRRDGRRNWAAATLAALALSCGGDSPTSPNPPPTPVSPATFLMLSASPPVGSSIRAGQFQVFTVRLRWTSASDSTTPPLFIVGHLRQTNGATVLDEPSDFHFPTPTLSGETEVSIDRQIVAGATACSIGWTLAARNQSGTTPVGLPVLTYPVTP